MQTTANFTRISPLAFAFYAEGGTPIYYFYETNLQGDIITIYDENGSKVVGFRYDAWGDCNTDKYNATIVRICS